MSEKKWPVVAVLGAGAVGSYFGGMLARSGAPVTLIGRAQHVEAVTRGGLLVESATFKEHIRIAATTDVAAAQAADLVLLCVKTVDTEKAALLLAPHLGSGARVVSIQNGVDNVERIRAASGIDAIPAVVYVAVEMPGPGVVRHTGRGDLIIGIKGDRESARVGIRTCENVASVFLRAGVPCGVSRDIEADLWIKLVMNCAYNAISALSRMRYGPLVADPIARDLMRETVEEVIRVARASGVHITLEEGLVEAVLKLADGMPGAISSTAQDIAAGRKTEIDSLNGYVARCGTALNVRTPVNQTLHHLVKLLEKANVE